MILTFLFPPHLSPPPTLYNKAHHSSKFSCPHSPFHCCLQRDGELLSSSADYLSTSTTTGVCQSEIGSWSCQLWYLHPSWVLTLLTKRDLYFCCRQPPFFSRSSFYINVWIYEGTGNSSDRQQIIFRHQQLCLGYTMFGWKSFMLLEL